MIVLNILIFILGFMIGMITMGCLAAAGRKSLEEELNNLNDER